MASNWTYHADGVGTAVSTSHQLNGDLSSVTIKLDTFKVREWQDEEEIRQAGKQPKNMHYEQDTGVYVEHADGAHASMKFVVDEGSATLKYIEPEDGEVVEPRHFALLPAAERVLDNMDGVEVPATPLQTIAGYYDEAEDVHIERLDG